MHKSSIQRKIIWKILPMTYSITPLHSLHFKPGSIFQLMDLGIQKYFLFFSVAITISRSNPIFFSRNLSVIHSTNDYIFRLIFITITFEILRQFESSYGDVLIMLVYQINSLTNYVVFRVCSHKHIKASQQYNLRNTEPIRI